MDLIETSKVPSLLHLNDDCLYEILKYLTVEELMVLYGEVHPRIDSVIGSCLGKWEINMRFSPPYNSKQLEFIGSNLHTLVLSAGYSIKQDIVLNILNPLCQGASASGKLRILHLHYVHWNFEYSECLRQIMPQLTVLDLSHIDVRIMNDLAHLLHHTQNLKELILKGVDNIDETILTEKLLSHLKVLRVDFLITPECCAKIKKMYPYLL